MLTGLQAPRLRHHLLLVSFPDFCRVLLPESWLPDHQGQIKKKKRLGDSLEEISLFPLLYLCLAKGKTQQASALRTAPSPGEWWRWYFSHSAVSDSCDPMACSPPGSSVHGILQARTLEWVAISFSRGSSPPRNQTQVSCTAGRFFTN